MKFNPKEAVEAHVIHAILESPAIVLGDLRGGSTHVRTHDDHDGTFEGKLFVHQDIMGDMFIQTDKTVAFSLRFRNVNGGTNSPRVHNAIKILAEAIRLDNLSRPEPSAIKEIPKA